jgi:glutathione synthase/RimK-type ligase-like ATP-grasp enzyme
MENGQDKFTLIILSNEFGNDHDPWIKACQHLSGKVEYRVVNLTKSNWLEEIQSSPFDLLLAKPSPVTSSFKKLYDERATILSKELSFRIYPSLDEILLYENKRYLSFWLKAHNIPHPKTDVFYYKDEAINYIRNCNYPFVAKLAIGASGNGVRIIKSKRDALKYVNQIFSRGISARTGPRFDKGEYLKRAWRKLTHLNELKERLWLYEKVSSNPQKGFCIFYQYISHEYEWRVIRVGDSFFAYKKMKVGEKASGLMDKVYANPPLSILDFVKKITDKFNFFSMAVDIFETNRDTYLVNEMQCIWGQKNDYQMFVNDKPGRYVYVDNKWVFEEGEFTKNKSYDLRLKYILSTITSIKPSAPDANS